MIVRLTDAQLAACYALAPPAAEAWLGRGTKVGAQTQDVPMPPIGWLKLRDRMMSEAFNVFGQRAGRAKGSLHRAVKRISLGLATLEAHPAFNGGALPGEHDTIFVAWWAPEGGLTPYPAEQGAWLMVPEWKTVSGLRVTRWKTELPTLPCSFEGLLNPSEHYRFSEPSSASQ